MKARVRRAAGVLFAACLSVSLPAQEDPPAPVPSPSPSAADERLQRIQERKAALEQEVSRLRGQEKTLLGEVERLELEVRLRSEEQREVQVVLQRANERLDATVKQARALEAEVERARPVLAARARALYKMGELSYVRLLLSVERPSDFLRGYRFITTLARRDNERIASFRTDLHNLTRTRVELEQKTQEALRLRGQLEQARRALAGERQRKTQLLTQIVKKKETRAAYLQELEDAEKRLSEMIAGLGVGEVTVPIEAFRGSLPWPVGGRVRSPFGRHKHPRFDTYTVQNGVEIEARAETPVAAVHEGKVVFAERFLGYGLMVVIDHGSKHHTLYAHLQDTPLRVGEQVRAGSVVGRVGTTSLGGPGLYFELRNQGKPEDPAEWLKDPG